MARGIEELLKQELLVKMGPDEVVAGRTMRGFEWVHTYQLTKPFNINLSKAEVERLEAEERGPLTPQDDADSHDGQPG